MTNELELPNPEQIVLSQETTRLKISTLVPNPLPSNLMERLQKVVEALDQSYTLILLSVYDTHLSNSPGVQVTLGNSSGKILDMGRRSCPLFVPHETTGDQMTNRNVLWNAMVKAGFIFSSKDWQRFKCLPPSN